jgi:16S rRNA U1498 N3-methylase RsmE
LVLDARHGGLPSELSPPAYQIFPNIILAHIRVPQVDLIIQHSVSLGATQLPVDRLGVKVEVESVSSCSR